MPSPRRTAGQPGSDDFYDLSHFCRFPESAAKRRVCDEDRGLNDEALKEGARIPSVYRDGETTFWIITEADRSATTVLLPEDY